MAREETIINFGLKIIIYAVRRDWILTKIIKLHTVITLKTIQRARAQTI